MGKVIVIPGSDFSQNAVAQIHFPNNPCTGISLDADSHAFTDAGQIFHLTAIPVPAYTDDPLVWESSNPGVATVNDGVVTSVGVGSATITVTCGDFSASCAVTAQVVVKNDIIPGYRLRCTSTGTGAGDYDGSLTKIADQVIARYYLLALNDETARVIADNSASVNQGGRRFCPLPLPAGVKKIYITAPVAVKTAEVWFDKDSAPSWGNGAKAIDGNHQFDSYDQDNFSTSVVITVPNTAGINAVGISFYGENTDAAYMTIDSPAERFTVIFAAS